MLDIKTLEALRVVEERVLHSLLAERHTRPEDPNGDAAAEHAEDGVALACRDVVRAVDAADPDERPAGWNRERTEAERATAEASKPAGYIVLLNENGCWTDNWDGTVHADRAAGDEALAKAKSAGYEAILTAALPVTEVPA